MDTHPNLTLETTVSCHFFGTSLVGDQLLLVQSFITGRFIISPTPSKVPSCSSSPAFTLGSWLWAGHLHFHQSMVLTSNHHETVQSFNPQTRSPTLQRKKNWSSSRRCHISLVDEPKAASFLKETMEKTTSLNSWRSISYYKSEFSIYIYIYQFTGGSNLRLYVVSKMDHTSRPPSFWAKATPFRTTFRSHDLRKWRLGHFGHFGFGYLFLNQNLKLGPTTHCIWPPWISWSKCQTALWIAETSSTSLLLKILQVQMSGSVLPQHCREKWDTILIFHMYNLNSLCDWWYLIDGYDMSFLDFLSKNIDTITLL